MFVVSWSNVSHPTGWLNWFTGSQPSTYHKSCEIKTTQKRILMLKPILVSYIVYLQWWFRSARCLVAERVLLLTRANNSVSLSVSLRNYPEWSTWSARTRPLSILHRVKYLVWMIVTFKNLPRVIYFVSLSMSSKNSTRVKYHDCAVYVQFKQRLLLGCLHHFKSY